MAFTVYQTNKKTGMVYAYRQEAYRDPETKRPKSRRTYLGRVDPVTHEIVEKETDGKRNRKKLGMKKAEDAEDRPGEAAALITELRQTIQEQAAQIEELTKQRNEYMAVMESIRAMASQLCSRPDK